MREIKFRGKNIVNGEWVYGYFWRDDICGDCHIREGNGVEHRVDPDTVSQLVCINTEGIYIYEGDYVKDIGESIWYVDFYDKNLEYIISLVKESNSEFVDYFKMRWLRDCVVVGNRWDNSSNDFLK